MNLTHSLLIRQLKKVYGDLKEVPKDFEPLLMLIDRAYHEYDNDNKMAERSLQISTQEMLGVMKNLEEEIAQHKMTERDLKKNQAETRVMYKDLESINKKLVETQSQLFQAERLETVGRLASGVAHEVKNPLMMIMQNIEFISKKVPNGNKNLQLAVKGTIDAVNRADGVIKGLLDFSKLKEVRMRLCNVNDIVKSALMLVKHSLHTKQIKVVKKLDSKLPSAFADKQKIEQVLINLMVNSIQAMDEKGVLTVHTYFKEATQDCPGVGLREEDPFQVNDSLVVIEITDSGPGIPEEIIHKIFDPFFTTKRGKEGTGLGLSIIRNIIDLHGGYVYLKNENKTGVKAVVILKGEQK